MITPGQVVRNKALAAGAADWIDGLPELVAGLERDWRITVGRRYDDSTEAFVARAVLADGRPAVLKLMIPRPGDYAAREITVLRLVDGDGCVRLLRADPDRGALLLERLGRSLDQLGLPVGRRHEILSALISAPVIDGHVATVPDRFEGLAQVTGEWVSGGDGVVPPHVRLPGSLHLRFSAQIQLSRTTKSQVTASGQLITLNCEPTQVTAPNLTTTMDRCHRCGPLDRPPDTGPSRSCWWRGGGWGW